MSEKIKRIVSLIKKELRYNLYYKIKYIHFNNIENNEYDKFKDKKKVIIMQTPTHNNLGDHAIAYAELEFKKRFLEDYIYIEIPFNDVMKESKKIKHILAKHDFIFVIGGGNMGDVYSYEEYTRRFIIEYFTDFNIISFPQTISFNNDFIGRWQLNKSIKSYKKNKNLLVVAREEKSFSIMKEVYKDNKVMLTPDIVLSLDKRNNFKRKGIVTCLRDDIEGVMNKEIKISLINLLKNKYDQVNVTDTVICKDVAINEREKELNKIWNLFEKSEVVITDRLHGMIFCAITATPCIVFRNSNHKIEETYNNWLSNLEYIKFCDIDSLKNENKIEQLVDELKKLNKNNKIFNNCQDKFIPLIKYIEELK